MPSVLAFYLFVRMLRGLGWMGLGPKVGMLADSVQAHSRLVKGRGWWFGDSRTFWKGRKEEGETDRAALRHFWVSILAVRLQSHCLA